MRNKKAGIKLHCNLVWNLKGMFKNNSRENVEGKPRGLLLLSFSLSHSLSVDSIPDTKQMAHLQPPTISLPKHEATPAPATHSQTDSWLYTLQHHSAAACSLSHSTTVSAYIHIQRRSTIIHTRPPFPQ